MCHFQGKARTPRHSDDSAIRVVVCTLVSLYLSSVTQAIQSDQVLDRPICFSDSKIALYWIRGFDKEWKQFVQNCVNVIRSLVPIGSW